MESHYTTLTNDAGDDVPVVMEYGIAGWHEIGVSAIRGDMPGEAGPDISQYFDKDEIAWVVEREIIPRIDWRKPDVRDLQNYAPQREL